MIKNIAIAAGFVFMVRGALAAADSKVIIDSTPLDYGNEFVWVSLPDTNPILVPVDELKEIPLNTVAKVLENKARESQAALIKAALATA